MTQNSDEWIEDDNREGSGAGKRILMELLGRWYWLALGAVLGGAASLYYLSKAPKVYRAGATLLVKEQTASVMGKDQVDQIDLGSVAAMNTVAERLKRQVLLERVAKREDVRNLEAIVPAPVRWLPEAVAGWLGDTAEEPTAVSASKLKPEVLAGRIGSWTKVEIRRGTRLLDITVTHRSPEIAKVLADAICLEYIEETTNVRSSGRGNTIELLAQKSEEARKSLQNSQNALAAYQRALSSHEELETKEREVGNLKRRYRAKHPEMINALAQVDNLQMRFLNDFNAAVKSGADKAFWQSEAAAETAAGDGSRAQDLSDQLESARQKLLSRTAVLRSEIQSQESVFNTMLTKMQEVEVNRAEQDSEVEISNLAQMPVLPVSPIGSKVFILGVFGGLMLGGGVAFAGIFLDNKFHTVMQVEELLGLPVLAAVNQISPAELEKAVAKSGERPGEGTLEREKNWNPKIAFRHGLTHTSFAETYRVLRASITLLGVEEKRKVTLFTSAIPGEGKSLTSANYALAAAGQGKRVLLIDLDLRRPAAHLAFGLTSSSNEAGVTGYLAGKATLDEAIIRDVSGTGMDLMVSGVRAPNPGELLNEQRLSSLMAAVRARYDVIVLDTAPLLAVPDTRVIAAHADNVCLVVRADYVPKGATARVVRLLATGRTPLAGVVFNGFRERRGLIGANYSYGNYKYGTNGNPYGYGNEAYGSRD